MSPRREAATLLADAQEPIAHALADPAIEDVAVNRPGGFWTRRASGWTYHAEPRLDFAWLEGLAVLAGRLREQNVGKRNPILSTDVPGTGPHPLRLEVVLPPAVPHDAIALCYRRPGDDAAPIEEMPRHYDVSAWNKWSERTERKRAASSALLDLYDSGDVTAFMQAVVDTRRTVLFCGPTGAGKTWLARTLTGSIRRCERVITIEDALEMTVPQPNHVRLLFSSSGLTGAALSLARLLKAALRLRPDRIMLQELRDPEAAWIYLNEGMTGHGGTLTTIHGADAPQAARRVFNLTKGSAEGASIQDATITAMLATAVDVIVPVAVTEGGRRALREVWVADDARRRGEGFADLLAQH